jgi:hypothetical protein
MTKKNTVATAAAIVAGNKTQPKTIPHNQTRARRMIAREIEKHLFVSDELIELIEQRDAIDYRIECEITKCLNIGLASL